MKQNRIDNYILGKMSSDEVLAFERNMEQNDDLRKEVDLHRDIVRAIRLKAAKEHLQKTEQKIKAEEHHRKIFTFTRYISIGAVAACLIVGVFLHYDTASNYRQYGLNNIQIEISSSRGGTDYSTRAAIEINNGNYDSALVIIEEGESVTFICEDSNPELQEQARLEYDAEQDALQWYKAVTYMRMGKYIKAKRLLKEIAASDSFYKNDAQKVLDEL